MRRLREAHLERRAAARRMHADRPAVLLRDALRDGQTEASSALFPARHERLEEPVLDLLGNARTGIRERQDEGLTGAILVPGHLDGELSALALVRLVSKALFRQTLLIRD